VKSGNLNYFGQQKKGRISIFSMTSVKIALTYILISSIWILFSDYLLKLLHMNPSVLVYVSIVKGWFFVAITGLMLYYLIESDIRALEDSEEQLRKKDEMYRLIVNGTTDGLWELDLGTGNLYFSPVLKEKAGYKEDIINSLDSWTDLMHPQDASRFLKELDNYVRRKIPKFNCEYRIRMKGTGYLWVHTKGQGILNDKGQITGVIGTHTEITERKEVEQKLKKANEENIKLINEVLAYDKLKTEFFTNISHEFRTPLNVILGSVQLIETYQNKFEDGLEIKCRLSKHMKVIRQNCYRLLKLINNLIDITKIDSGDLKMYLEYCNIVKVVEQLTLSVMALVESKSITLTFNSEKDEIFTACDINKIERIILNLLSNATKYNKSEGNISVNIKELDDYVLISVMDTGIGIPVDKINIIFDRFRQVNSSLTREHEGSGIGLSIVKSLVEMHEGEIWVESELGVGSEFCVKLPIAARNTQSTFPVEKSGSNKCLYMADVEFSDIHINH
jgi:PAS domain S-box-containing protein